MTDVDRKAAFREELMRHTPVGRRGFMQRAAALGIGGAAAFRVGGAAFAQAAVGLLPDGVAKKLMNTAGVDRLAALHLAFDAVQRGGTVSLSGVYAGEADPMPMKSLFDKQISIKMGQCNVQAWRDELLPIVEDPSDPLGTMDLVTHRVPLDRAPEMYEIFQKKEDGCIKVVLTP